MSKNLTGVWPSGQIVDIDGCWNIDSLCDSVFPTNCPSASLAGLHTVDLLRFCLSFMSPMRVHNIFEMQLPSCPRVNSLQHWNRPSVHRKQHRVACRALQLMLNACYPCQHVCFIDFVISTWDHSLLNFDRRGGRRFHFLSTDWLTHTGEARTNEAAAGRTINLHLQFYILQHYWFVQDSHSSEFSLLNEDCRISVPCLYVRVWCRTILLVLIQCRAVCKLAHLFLFVCFSVYCRKLPVCRYLTQMARTCLIVCKDERDSWKIRLCQFWHWYLPKTEVLNRNKF